jgi:adenine-specific DNA-methyltransferase
VLDFFAGSGTTCEAVAVAAHEDHVQRRYLAVQLPEPYENKEGNLAGLLRARVRAAYQQLDAAARKLGDALQEDHGFRALRLTPSNFSVWIAAADSEGALSEQLSLAVDHVAEGSDERSILTELLLKAGFPLTSAVDHVDFGGVKGYSAADGALLVCLSPELTIEAFEAMVELDPAMILVLDAGFGGNDELKVNALQTVRARNQQRGSDIALRVV